MNGDLTLLAAAAGVLITAGLWAIGAGVYGSRRPAQPIGGRAHATRSVPRRISFIPSRRRFAAGSPPRSGRTWAIAGLAAALVWLATSWPVAALVTAAGVVGLPSLLATSTASAREIERLEALEEWTRRLADVLTIGVGLEQAIAASLRTAPGAITAEVTALAARLGARWPTEAALRAFADDLDDATGDLVAAALILGSRRRGPGLAAVLDGLAATVAEDVAMRRKVEADRARPRTTARWVTLITLGVVGLAALNGTYIRPYRTTVGQLVLIALALAFAAALVWMRTISRGTPEPRFLSGQGQTP